MSLVLLQVPFLQLDTRRPCEKFLLSKKFSRSLLRRTSGEKTRPYEGVKSGCHRQRAAARKCFRRSLLNNLFGAQKRVKFTQWIATNSFEPFQLNEDYNRPHCIDCMYIMYRVTLLEFYSFIPLGSYFERALLQILIAFLSNLQTQTFSEHSQNSLRHLHGHRTMKRTMECLSVHSNRFQLGIQRIVTFLMKRFVRISSNLELLQFRASLT